MSTTRPTGEKFRIVCATRVPAERFFSATALGRSLAVYQGEGPELRLFAENSVGLPALYNTALREAAADPAVLIFVHDDVYLCDHFWPMHVTSGLARFDILGLAGNTRRVAGQPAWMFIDNEFTWDDRANLSGIVAHGTGFPPRKLIVFGPPCREVKLLDGVMLVARSETLLSRDITFDERFDFHFYDMDFCRQAEQKRVTMGTWTISIVHESPGAFGGDQWVAAYGKYMEKWGS